MHLRIIGGRLRGKKLYSMPGTHTRPTADRVRESVFNILVPRISGIRVLDLFSGTGVLGLEALSRGAVQAVFVDNHPQPISVIRRNLSECRLDAAALVLRRDLRYEFSWHGVVEPGFRLVFMDPPYNQGLVVPTLDRLHASRLLEKEAVVMVEHSHLEQIGEDVSPFTVMDRRKYGKTLVSFLRYAI